MLDLVLYLLFIPWLRALDGDYPSRQAAEAFLLACPSLSSRACAIDLTRSGLSPERRRRLRRVVDRDRGGDWEPLPLLTGWRTLEWKRHHVNSGRTESRYYVRPSGEDWALAWVWPSSDGMSGLLAQFYLKRLCPNRDWHNGYTETECRMATANLAGDLSLLGVPHCLIRRWLAAPTPTQTQSPTFLEK